tara:strand:+ start:9914 stop:11236 length:1323 start_codon:yes stop_codon:yes gene_type:complete
MNYIIYIPIEIKNRELQGHLLLSHYLLDYGFKIIIGNKPKIYELILNKPNKSGVFLYKGGGRNPELIKSISSKVEHIYILDQEIGYAVRDYEIFISRRYFKSTYEFIKKFFFLNHKISKMAHQYASIPLEKCITSGWPRVDLYKKQNIWSGDVNSIKSKYGNFILFASDFATNTSHEVSERIKRVSIWSSASNKTIISKQSKIYQQSYQEYKLFIKIINNLSNQHNFPLLIIRPHHGEDFNQWLKDLLPSPKIIVINEGPIAPWIIASNGLLHRGCTSSVEAYFYNKPTAHLVNCAVSSKDTDTIKVSLPLNSDEELLEWMNKPRRKDIDSDCFDIGQENSAQFIANTIAENVSIKDLLYTKLKFNIVSLFSPIMPKFLKILLKNILFKYKNPGLKPLANYEQKMNGGILKYEIFQFFKEYLNYKPSVKKLSKDLFLIEK